MSVTRPYVGKRKVYVEVSHKTTLSAQEAFACLVLYIDDTEEGGALRTMPSNEWFELNQKSLTHVCKSVLFQLGHRRVATLAAALDLVKTRPNSQLCHEHKHAMLSLRDRTNMILSDIRVWAHGALTINV